MLIAATPALTDVVSCTGYLVQPAYCYFWGERKGHLSKNICGYEEKLDAYCILKDIGEGKVDYHKQIRSHFHKTVISYLKITRTVKLSYFLINCLSVEFLKEYLHHCHF